jgi:hypothetical protein
LTRALDYIFRTFGLLPPLVVTGVALGLLLARIFP